MQLNANTGSPQPFEDVAMLVGRRGIKPDHGQMHGREHIVWNVKQAHRQGSEKLAVERELTIAFGHNALKTLQLAEAQGSLQIREAVVEAKLLLLIDPGTSRTLLKTVARPSRRLIFRLWMRFCADPSSPRALPCLRSSRLWLLKWELPMAWL